MVIEIEVRDVKVHYRSVKALDGVSISVRGGEVLSIIGPNGAGKSTLLRVINGVLKPHLGTVLIDKTPIRDLRPKDVAKRVGYVPQGLRATGMLTVYDFVMTGRRPYVSFAPTKEDEEEVYRALEAVGISELADRALEELSGGELQRAVIARALAGDPEIMLLDEPTGNLDLKYQAELLNLIRAMRSRGLTIIMAMHDLTQAYRISDKVLMLKNGRAFAAGRPEDVLTPDNILNVYGVPVALIKECGAIVPLLGARSAGPFPHAPGAPMAGQAPQ
jgi:iron complex transport system ATP-binding protein